MSFAQVYTRSVVGLHAPKVIIEVHLSQGLPALTIIGLPEAAVREPVPLATALEAPAMPWSSFLVGVTSAAAL